MNAARRRAIIKMKKHIKEKLQDVVAELRAGTQQKMLKKQ